MSRARLINHLKKDNPKINNSEIENIIEIFCNAIEETLKDGCRVELRGFGMFSSKIQKARISRNPKTNEKINTPTKKTIHFKMSKDMFNKLNNEKE